jgi:hypothetical protein
MEIVIALAVGILIGVCIGMVWRGVYLKTSAIGDLRVDRSDPDSPYLFLELNEDQSVRTIEQQNYVMLRVKVENFISQK